MSLYAFAFPVAIAIFSIFQNSIVLFDVSLSLLVGSLAAAFSVEKIGNNPLKKINMIKSVEYLLK